MSTYEHDQQVYCYPQYDQITMDMSAQQSQHYESTESTIHHHQHHPQQGNHGFSYQGPPVSLKRKSPMYAEQNQTSSHYGSYIPMPLTTIDQSQPQSILPTSPRQTICDICKYPDPILFVPDCGHTFHSRCVGEWPMIHCPYCQGPVPKIAVVQIDMNTKTAQRSGKWTKQEEKFVNLIVDEFDHGTFPLANGTPVRLVLAKLLNCSPMRLSKKFQKNALGKRTYRVPKGNTSNGSRICFDSASHQARQIEFSAIESAFRQEVVLLQRKDNKQDGYIELRDLRLAVVQFWVSNFLKFALSVGQQVEGLDTTEPKKKKQTMQKLRDGMFDQVLSWGEKRPPSPPPVHGNGMNSQWEVPYFKQEVPYKTYDENDNHDDRGYKPEMSFQPPPMEYKPHVQQPMHAQYRETSVVDPSYNYNQLYKRPNSMRDPSASRMALTPLSMRAGGASIRPHVDNHGHYDTADQSTSPELDGLLMSGNTPSNAGYRSNPIQHQVTTNTYDPMEPIAQLPPNTSWDQMLDDFTGINTHLVDPSMNTWPNIPLS